MQEMVQVSLLDSVKKELARAQKKQRKESTRAEDLENQLVEAKMKWANLDMENDELAIKLN